MAGMQGYAEGFGSRFALHLRAGVALALALAAMLALWAAPAGAAGWSAADSLD